MSFVARKRGLQVAFSSPSEGPTRYRVVDNEKKCLPAYFWPIPPRNPFSIVRNSAKRLVAKGLEELSRILERHKSRMRLREELCKMWLWSACNAMLFVRGGRAARVSRRARRQHLFDNLPPL